MHPCKLSTNKKWFFFCWCTLTLVPRKRMDEFSFKKIKSHTQNFRRNPLENQQRKKDLGEELKAEINDLNNFCGILRRLDKWNHITPQIKSCYVQKARKKNFFCVCMQQFCSFPKKNVGWVAFQKISFKQGSFGTKKRQNKELSQNQNVGWVAFEKISFIQWNLAQTQESQRTKKKKKFLTVSSNFCENTQNELDQLLWKWKAPWLVKSKVDSLIFWTDVW